MVTLPVPNVALVEYPAPENYAAARLPAVRAGAAGHGVLIGRPAPRYFLRAAVKVPFIWPPAMATVPFMVSFSTVPL